jgi:hydrogenase maturation protein HypF
MKFAAGVLDWGPAILCLVAELRQGVAPGVAAYRFHNGLARGIVEVARFAGKRQVVLTGGCFQNVLLTELTMQALRRAGFEPHCHRQIPPNDGGLAAGQLWLEA